jgi:hypothetical protein
MSWHYNTVHCLKKFLCGNKYTCYIFATFRCGCFMKTHVLICCVHRVNLLFTVRLRDTYQETGDPARLLTQLDGRYGQRNWNSIRRGKRIFCSGPTIEQPRQNKNLLYRHATIKRTNQGRTLLICSLWVPICLRINSQHGPHFSSLSG